MFALFSEVQLAYRDIRLQGISYVSEYIQCQCLPYISSYVSKYLNDVTLTDPTGCDFLN